MEYLLIMLTALFNAAMDIIDHEYYNSIFTKISWMKNIWLDKYKNYNVDQGIRKLFWKIPLPSFLWNGWYLFKNLMILSIILATFSNTKPTILNFIFMILLWTISFEFGYGFLFRKFGRKEYFKRLWSINIK